MDHFPATKPTDLETHEMQHASVGTAGPSPRTGGDISGFTAMYGLSVGNAWGKHVSPSGICRFEIKKIPRLRQNSEDLWRIWRATRFVPHNFRCPTKNPPSPINPMDHMTSGSGRHLQMNGSQECCMASRTHLVSNGYCPKMQHLKIHRDRTGQLVIFIA